MHVTSNCKANRENCSFSNLTNSRASFSIFSWIYFGIDLEIITLSNPCKRYVKNCKIFLFAAYLEVFQLLQFKKIPNWIKSHIHE